MTNWIIMIIQQNCYILNVSLCTRALDKALLVLNIYSKIVKQNSLPNELCIWWFLLFYLILSKFLRIILWFSIECE